MKQTSDANPHITASPAEFFERKNRSNLEDDTHDGETDTNRVQQNDDQGKQECILLLLVYVYLFETTIVPALFILYLYII